MAPLSPFLCLCLFLCARAEMNNSRQSSTPNTVFCAYLSFEDSSLCAESDSAEPVSAVQLTVRYSPTASNYNFVSQCLQSIVLQPLQPEHIFNQCFKLLVYHTLWPDTRLRHIWAYLSDRFHNSWSKPDLRDHNYCTTMLVLSQCTISIS